MSYEFAKKPDLPSRTNKPLKKTYSHAAKGLYGLSSFYPVTQRVKIEGNDVDFGDSNVQALIKCALLTKPIFLHGIMQGYYPERNQDEVADELIASVADELSNNPRECKNYDGVAQEVASMAKGRLDSERKERERRSYKIGDRSMLFEESDRHAIEGDILFGKIRGEQQKGGKINETVEMPKMKYTDFYSRSAMRDEVTRWLISQGASSDEGMGRTSSMYRVDFQQDGEADISLKKAYASSTLHHIIPLSVLTAEYEGDRSDEEKLQQHEWNAKNLVLGPDRNRRIYEPGDATDFEAGWISKMSDGVAGAHDVQKAEPQKLQPIRMESPSAAMRTDYLQYFYSMCQKYIECMDPAKPELRGNAPRNLVELAQLMRSRFAMIEVRHNDAALLGKLTNLINTFVTSSENSDERLAEVKKMVAFLIEYGKGEDIKETQGA